MQLGTRSDPTIFLVEDDKATRDAMTMVLESEGYRVKAAANGREALDRLRDARPPRLILLDLMMPVMNGWQFRDAQTRDPRLASIPVVLFSAEADLSQKAKNLGIAGYLQKPVEFDELLATVREHC
jgi:CheY-like chemotaxis protein